LSKVSFHVTELFRSTHSTKQVKFPSGKI